MSIEDFTERRQFRGRETVRPNPRSKTLCMCHWDAASCNPACSGRLEIPCDSQQQFTPDELRRAECALDKWHRHTVDIAGPAPVHVEDEALAFERGWRRAKVAWAVLFVLVVGYMAWRLLHL